MAKADVAVAATLADPRYMQAAEVTGARREHLAYVFSSAIDVLYFRRYHDTHCRWYSHMFSNFKNQFCRFS
ncbi:hypothetical protein HID58_067600 [Brassica napus]|uniref:Uncharacterized protein n=3 Tax=Brassica TaxID=3705 RepID=A0ABQ7ZJG5_BRANA|nr:hypothetical protein HID58_067600 [Brassica napus]CDY24574.1 BnaC05g32580D [Brassica napus]VDD45633.1 unnamed protein product [Brassica oleracea]